MGKISLGRVILLSIASLFFMAAGQGTKAAFPIKISEAWVRPSEGPNSAAYMSIKNTGNDLDELGEVYTEACEHVELHRIEKEKGIFRMRSVKTIDIPSDAVTLLRPSGMHLMLMKLKKPLKEGEKVLFKMIFKKAGVVTVVATVEARSSESCHGSSPEASSVSLKEGIAPPQT